MGIECSSTGSFSTTQSLLQRILQGDRILAILHRYGEMGVNTLSNATPIESGETASSWYYEAKKEKGGYSITWRNRHVVDGSVIAILIQYGHGTGTGGYVPGKDYINPAIKPIFDRIKAEVFKEVTG